MLPTGDDIGKDTKLLDEYELAETGGIADLEAKLDNLQQAMENEMDEGEWEILDNDKEWKPPCKKENKKK